MSKPKTKTIELTPDRHEALRHVCDIALRGNGIASFPAVRQLIEAAAISEPEEDPEGDGSGS